MKRYWQAYSKRCLIETNEIPSAIEALLITTTESSSGRMHTRVLASNIFFISTGNVLGQGHLRGIQCSGNSIPEKP